MAICTLSLARCAYQTRGAARPSDTTRSTARFPRIDRPGRALLGGRARWTTRHGLRSRRPSRCTTPRHRSATPTSSAPRRQPTCSRAGGDYAAMVGANELAALSPDGAGRLVGDLAVAGRVDALTMVVIATAPHRYPVVTLLAPPPHSRPALYARDMLVRAVALAPSLRLRSALAEVGDDPALTRSPRPGGRRPHLAGCRAAVPLVAGARDGDGRAPWGRRSGGRTRRRRRSRRGRLPRSRRRRHAQDLSPPGSRRHRAAQMSS